MSITFNNDKTLILIHKNASTWLKNMLIEILGQGDQKGDDQGMWKASYYKAHTVIAFVRNPWDRILSGYLYSKKYWKHQEKEYGPYPEYVDYLKAIEEKGIGNIMWQSFNRQVDYIDVPLADLYFLGRHEALHEDFGRLCEKMEVKIPDEKIYRTNFRKAGNRSRGRTGGEFGYRDYYTKETRELVKRLYQADIKEFGYKF